VPRTEEAHVARPKNTNGSLVSAESRSKLGFSTSKVLVGALWEERHQNHQVGQGKQPLVGTNPGGLSGPSDETEVAPFGEVVDVLHANTRKRGNFRIGEYLLAGLDGNHGPSPRKLNPTACYFYLTRFYKIRCCLHLICSYEF